MTTLVNLQTNKLILSTLVSLGGYKQGFSTVTGLQGSLLPLSGEKTTLYGGVMGKSYQLFTDYSEDIREGDRLQDVETGKRYKVVNGGVTRRVFGSMDFNSIIVTEIN